MASRTATGSALYLGQTDYNGAGSIGRVIHFGNSETSTVTMISDPSSTGSPIYGSWNNTGSRPENYVYDDDNLDLGEAIRMDTDGDGDLTDEPWLRVTDFDRYSLAFEMTDGSIENGVGVVVSGTDPATGNVYQALVFGDGLVSRLNDTGVNISNIKLTGYIPTSGSGASLTDVFQMDNFANVLADYTIAPCFVRGTLIETDQGPIRVEALQPGDRILTADHGYQEIRWIGSRKVAARDNLAPICIAKGALGNREDLWVSPQHRMLITGEQAKSIAGEDEVLVPAKALVNDSNIMVRPGGMVEYFHILLDRHEVIFANGIRAESLYLGGQALKGLHGSDRMEIMALFPEIAAGNIPQGARSFLTVGQGRQLVRALRQAA